MPSMLEPVEVEWSLGERRVVLETGKVARQAHGAVVAREGKAYVLATVVAEADARGSTGMVPLTVDYRERMAAGGRIPGSHTRRENRNSDREVLICRLIDRSLRPLIPRGLGLDVQLCVTVFSAEPGTDLETLALVAAGAALHLSDIPFQGPVVGTRVARVKDTLKVAPSPAQVEQAALDLVISVGPAGVVMLEGRAQGVPEAAVLEALDTAAAALAPASAAVELLRQRAGKPKRSTPVVDDAALINAVDTLVGADLDAALAHLDKLPRKAGLEAARQSVLGALVKPEGPSTARVEEVFDQALRRRARANTLAGKRITGRRPDEIRPIHAEVGLLASNHGSALFCRGSTQALVSCTLGNAGDALRLEGLGGNTQQRFMLHYNFPPWSVGEVGSLHGPGRREVGHGTLAMRALEAVLPGDADSRYTIRVVSDVTESDGSSSMATVCGGTLALMDAGVKLKAPVAGVALGLVREGQAHVILSDICGDEDHVGDMDFKVAGTADGITAIQLDNAGGGLERALLEEALEQARRGRHHVLSAMRAVLPAARTDVATHAPQTTDLHVDPSRVGTIIGKGGATIREIQKATDTRIDIHDDGKIVISGKDQEALNKAVARIQEMAVELREGGTYAAVIDEIKDYGVFVRIGDHRGLVHISEWEDPQPKTLEGRAQKGQETRVQLVSVNNRGQLVLSRRAAAKPA